MVSNILNNEEDCVMSDKSKISENIKKNFTFKKKLIVQVRKHPALYDNNHKFFSNVAKKELMWKQIARDLKVDVDVCKHSWIELRYNYQCHARRLRNYFMTGHKQNRKRPAMYFESELMFLWRFVENRKCCNLPFDIHEFVKELEPEPGIISEIEPQHHHVEMETELNVAEDVIVEEKKNDSASKYKEIDDDLILVEPPVELIIIDEDDDTGKFEKQFKISSSMKILIAQIKSYPELYDSEHLAFKDYTRKSYIWNAIAVNLSDKATKLMKCWIIMQTRYEWEICKASRNNENESVTSSTPSQLQNELGFLKNYILKNPNTVYKQSYYLKTSWFDPIDYFKDIYNLIVRMKKMSDIVYITDSLLKIPEKNKKYLTLWSEIANLKGSSPGQCETTWLIMRYFYWELMSMRLQNYQLTDKWYFETIITELYAISKAAHTAKQQELQVLNQNKNKKSSKRRSSPLNKFASKNMNTNDINTTTQIIPTIINSIQTVSTSNSTLTTTSIAGQPTTLPKITAAISLAPQTLNTGSLQIKKISGPPSVTIQQSLAPQPQTVHGTTQQTVATTQSQTIKSIMTTSAGSTILTSTVQPQVQTPMQMSFNFPNQLKVTSVPLPSTSMPTIRPMVTSTQSVIPNNAQTMISIRPKATVRQMAPKINIMPKLTPATITTTVRPIMTSTALTQMTQSISSLNLTTPPPLRLIASQVTTPVLSSKSIAAPTQTSTPSSSSSTATSQLPKISSAVSLLNPNEILIELIASQNGNHLVVHGPPLSTKFQLSMPIVAKFIREVLGIPLLHNKYHSQPTLINSYWEKIAQKFNLPVHICRACWNFLLENFSHFPQIAPLKELMKPFPTSFGVWKESVTLFEKFDEHCISMGWLQYMNHLPEVVECISAYPVLYQDIAKETDSVKLSDMETLCAWRTISLRFPKIPQLQEIWISIKNCFRQYMSDLEFGIENKWPLNWWRALARLKFLVETKYSPNEPFYYIISNKMVEEIERCAMLEMKTRHKKESVENGGKEDTIFDLEEESLPSGVQDSLGGRKYVELGTLLTVIQKYPAILGKTDNISKYEAWKQVAKDLHMEVTDCLLAFRQVILKYYAFKKQDPVNRCRLNEKYYKKLDEIVRTISSNKATSSRGKLNIKTPFELNQSLESSSSLTDLVFPERYIGDISMSNSPSNLVVKNWVYGFGNLNVVIHDSIKIKLHRILKRYLKNLN